MVDASVEAKFLNGIFALLFATSYADHITSFEFGNLPDDGSNRAGGCCDHYRLSRYRLTNLQQAHIRSKPWHPKYAEGIGRMLHLLAKVEDALSIRNGVLLPATLAQHQIAGRKVGMVRDLDPADGRSHHDFADRYRWRVRGRIAHSATHIGVER